MSKKIHVRPSGAQSKVGFAVGILFCLIGLFFAIPTFGIFGVFWTAVAGWITYVHWRNGFSDNKIDSHVIEVEDIDPDNVTITSHRGFGTSYTVNTSEFEDASDYDSSDMERRLKSLQSLYEQRLITKEEYEEKKQEILKEL